jgi:hypothetical protein
VACDGAVDHARDRPVLGDERLHHDGQALQLAVQAHGRLAEGSVEQQLDSVVLGLSIIATSLRIAPGAFSFARASACRSGSVFLGLPDGFGEG